MKKIYTILFTMLLAFVGTGSAWAREYASGETVYVDQLQEGDVIEYGVEFDLSNGVIDEYIIAFFATRQDILDGKEYGSEYFMVGYDDYKGSLYTPGLKVVVNNKEQTGDYTSFGMGYEYTINCYIAPQETTQPASVLGYDGSNYYYGTYYANYSWKVPEGYEALIVSNVNNGFATVSRLASEGQTIPAGQGVLLRGLVSNGNIAIEGSEDDPVACSGNLLKGTINDTFVSAGDVYYKLSYDREGHHILGFYWDSTSSLEEGAGINAKAYKAYLAVPNTHGSSNSLSLRFADTETAVERVNTEAPVQNIYNLQGQRVNAAKAGVYVQNGKKVIR